MSRANISFLAFNRGILSPKALARVDLDRTRLSAEIMTNWLAKTQGAMRLRPGTKYLGSSINDTGAEFIEFVAATDDAALLELTHQKMRVWIDDALMARPHVDTTLSLTDTGWTNASTGGAVSTPAVDLIPQMTGAVTSGVKITASAENIIVQGAGDNRAAWRAGDDNISSLWQDTGVGETSDLPIWWNVDFCGGDTGIGDTGNRRAVTSYSLRSNQVGSNLDNMPSRWRLLASNFDTGSYAADTGKWTQEDTQGSETGWAANERRVYQIASGDTGTVPARRHWRFYFDALDGDTFLMLNEIEMFSAAAAQQVKVQSGRVILNATSVGANAIRRKRVAVDTGDIDVEHSLDIYIPRGPVTLRVGSTEGDDDYVGEASLGTGYHNLAFTPVSDFHVSFQYDGLTDRVVETVAIGDSGTVELTTFLDAEDLGNIRYDQSADVVYLDAAGVAPHKIERRGTGRSWSFVKYEPDGGPFLSAASSSAKLSVAALYGNTTLRADVPFFKSGHVGALMRLFNSGQSGKWPLGALNAATDAIEVTGIGDTGRNDSGSERRVVFSVTGTWSGTITIERSFDGPDIGFHPASSDFILGGSAPNDTGTFTRTIHDEDDNVSAWYRARLSAYSSGAAIVTATYQNGGVNGIARVTGYNTNENVDIEVLSRFSDTGGTDSWQEGAWSAAQRYPSAVALHGGRLSHAAGASLHMSVPDDYENFNPEVEGDAAPIFRTLGSGPVDNIYYLISLLRLIIGTSGSEIELRSSSLDEPVTAANSSARAFSTQGSMNLRALKMDTSALAIQRSQQRLVMVGFGSGPDALGGYETVDLTKLAPDLLEAGVVSIGIQRQPDTRIHCVLGNGKVAILTYEPQEEVLCWHEWETQGAVEKVAVLPGTSEDKVNYHVRRTVNGVTKRFLEKLAMESESVGDTGLSWLADCAVSGTDTGKSPTIRAPHLAGEAVIVWASDTGQSNAGKDLSPDVDGVQTTYTLDTGAGEATLSESVHHYVAGLPYQADWCSTKLAYAAEAGTALAQMKRTDKIAFVLYQTHNNGLFFGNDTGNLDPLPRMVDGAEVDADKIFQTFDKVAMPFPGLWDTDSRIRLRAKAPRPCMVLAAIPTIQTNEKV